MWLTWLADAARKTNFPVIEVGGWQTRGHGPMTFCEGVVGHHTAGPATGDYPSLRVVRDGRPDLAGPLSHLGIGRTGVVYVIAAGACWHAGVSAYGGFSSLNDKFIGIEAESTGHDDWTPSQRACYPKLVATMLYQMGRGVDRYVSHRTCALPSGRKIDPTGLDDAWMRDKASAWLTVLGRPVPPGASTSLPNIALGETSTQVRRLQEFMTAHFPTYNAYVPSGFYGPQTQAGVAEFQRRVGITGPDADGSHVGPRTNARLWDFGYRG